MSFSFSFCLFVFVTYTDAHKQNPPLLPTHQPPPPHHTHITKSVCRSFCPPSKGWKTRKHAPFSSWKNSIMIQPFNNNFVKRKKKKVYSYHNNHHNHNQLPQQQHLSSNNGSLLLHESECEREIEEHKTRSRWSRPSIFPHPLLSWLVLILKMIVQAVSCLLRFLSLSLPLFRRASHSPSLSPPTHSHTHTTSTTAWRHIPRFCCG